MKINVAVFFGGQSCEHEISCITANQALKALDNEKYEIIPVYVAKNNDLYTGEKLFELKNYYDLDALCGSLEKICLYKDGNRTCIRPLKGLFAKPQNIDVAFLAMHGTGGEDGTLQGMLELMDIPYTSSNVLGSAVGQDKIVMKQVLEYEKLPILPWFYVFSKNIGEEIKDIEKKAEAIGYPLIAKPSNLGSSIGIEIIHSKKELLPKLKEAGAYDSRLVIEKMVTGLKEVNISVMGNVYDARLSAIEEVMKNDELLSFRDKYESGGSKKGGAKMKIPGSSKGMASTSRKIPARLTKKQEKEVRETALKAFRALGANGVVRIDYIIDEDTNKVYLNEINSIPGSLAFYLWKEEGIDFTEECDKLIDNALKMYREKKKMIRSFDTNILSNYKEG
ncbi:MAG: D-alanine--D-alanine ligase [Erysipelotrichaceae bacterium]|nr:D-alanine--D-alanine ligase [Erysipelotrichaceae bacterium]